jgi:nucleoside-diphosphate kinase
MTERTFLMVKPDGVQRRLVGEIVRRFEDKGFTLTALKMLTPTRQMAEAHYEVHRGKPFFEGVVNFIASGSVVAMIWEGDNVVAAPGTIRGDFANTIEQNLIHGSDSVENADTEIGIWFE